jgi:hypothetical protein
LLVHLHFSAVCCLTADFCVMVARRLLVTANWSLLWGCQ